MRTGVLMAGAFVGALLVGCASSTPRATTHSLVGPRVEDSGAVKEWKEGEQEAIAARPAAEPGLPGVDRPLDSRETQGLLRTEPTPQPPSSGRGSKEIFPFVRVDVERKLVEFDAEVPAYAYVGKEGVVYLEVIVCTQDTREHEAVLVTKARAADVHAALLMIGLTPGAPGGWEWKEKTLLPILPTGDAVDVAFVVERDGTSKEEAAPTWIVNAATGKTLADEMSGGEGFVFAGSGFVTRGGGERYAADGAGTLIGLATFGTETIAWKRVFSPESSVDEPVWAVKRDVQPSAGTSVVVRICKK